MTHRTTEILVGAAVLAAAVGFFIYATQVTGSGPVGRAAGYSASFRSVEGISIGTDVRLAGIRVGSVTGMVLNPANFRADVTFTVDSRLKLPEDTAALIASEGLAGGAFIELQPGGSPFSLEPGAEIEDTQGAVSLINLLLGFVSGGGGGGDDGDG